MLGRANGPFVVVGPTVPGKVRDTIAEALQAEVVRTSVAGSAIVGALLALNDQGIVVTDFATQREVGKLRDATGLPVATTPGVFNAMGNNVLAGPDAALVHPDVEPASVAVIEETLDAHVEQGTIAGLNTVGAAACVNGAGVLTHPKADADELDRLERLFRLPVAIGTVNHGAPLVGAGVIANAHGAVVGTETTGPELNRIENALGYLD